MPLPSVILSRQRSKSVLVRGAGGPLCYDSHLHWRGVRHRLACCGRTLRGSEAAACWSCLDFAFCIIIICLILFFFVFFVCGTVFFSLSSGYLVSVSLSLVCVRKHLFGGMDCLFAFVCLPACVLLVCFRVLFVSCLRVLCLFVC